MSNFDLNFNIKVNNELQNELKKSLAGTKKLNDSLKKTNTSIKLMSRSVKLAVKGFRGLVSAATSFQAAIVAVAAISFGRKIVNESIKVKNALIGLSSVANNLNLNVGETQKAAQELAEDGLIPLSDVSRSLKNLLASGLELPQAIKLFKAFRQSAAFNRQGQLSLNEAVVRATEGFKNRLSTLVDNAGITKNLSQIEKEYSQRTGESTARLNERQKSLILSTGLIKEASVFQGDYNRLLSTFSGRLTEAKTTFTLFLAALGDVITNSRVSQSALATFTATFKQLTVLVKENGDFLIKVFTKALVSTAQVVIVLTKSFLQLVAAVQKVIAVVKELKNPFKIISNLAIEGQKGITAIALSFFKTGKAAQALTKNYENLQKAQKKLIGDESLDNIRKSTSEIDKLVSSLEGLSTSIGRDFEINTKVTTQTIQKSNVGKSAESGLLSSLKSLFSSPDLLSNIGQGLSSLLQGKEGFLGLVEQFGGPFGTFIRQLGSMNEEQVRANIEAFAKAAPEFIKGLIRNIPVFIEAFIAAIPELVTSLFETIIAEVSSGKLAIAIIRGVLNGLSRAVSTFFKGFLRLFTDTIIKAAEDFTKGIVRGAGEFIKEIIKGAGSIFGGGDGQSKTKRIVKGVATGGLSEVVSGVKKIFKFSHGGSLGKVAKFADGGTGSITGSVPQGFPADTFPAALTSGETVITRDTTRKLEGFLDRQTSSNQPQTIVVRSDINEKTLIETIIRLKRNGQLEV